MRKRKLLILCLVLVVIYALAGFFALPAALKPRLISAIEQSTGRSVHIGTVRTNPFTFSLTLDDFILLDRDSTPFVSFKELYVRYRVTSVFRHAWAFAQLHLDTPYVAIRVMRNGKLSISDLLESPPADSAHHTGDRRSLYRGRTDFLPGPHPRRAAHEGHRFARPGVEGFHHRAEGGGSVRVRSRYKAGGGPALAGEYFVCPPPVRRSD